MFETLKRLWQDKTNNGLTEIKLDIAVSKGWITENQKIEIMSQ